MMEAQLKLAVNTPVYDFVLGKILAPALLERVQTDETIGVLEIGCGRGGTTRSVRKAFPNARITAVDIDPAQIRLSKRFLAGYDVDTKVGDHANLEFSDSSFDLVIEFNTIHHVRDWRAAIREAARVLRPQGTFAIGGVTGASLRTPVFGSVVAPKSIIATEDLHREILTNDLVLLHDCSAPAFMRHVYRKTVG